MATEAMSAPAVSTQKMSRYRSVRRAQEQNTTTTTDPGQFAQQEQPSQAVSTMPPMIAVPESEPHNDAPLSRSMSRYHRRPATSHVTSPQPPVPRSNAAFDTQQAVYSRSPPSTSSNDAQNSPPQKLYAANTAQRRPRTARPRAEASPHAYDAPRQQSLSGDDSAREILHKEKERQRQMREKYDAEARARKQAQQAELDKAEKLRKDAEEAARLQQQQKEFEEAEALRRQRAEKKAEQDRGKRLQKAEPRNISQSRDEEARKTKQEERQRQATLAKLEERAQKAPPSPAAISPPRQQEVGFGMFKRRKDEALGLDAPAQFSAPPQLSLSFSSHEEETIRPGGGGVVLGIDAPTSAVNAGDRRVTVVCNKKRITLPVTPTTTPLDLIKSAATVLTDPIDIRTAVISEYFTKVSITRPLRNYEYVRDVMNSWDHDNQNELTIIDSDVDGINQDDLLAYKVPETRPEGMSCFIQYSSRPGKWSKRLLTLRPDGQLVMAKNEKTKEKDLENICTLTDYDIYSITQQKLARVKPPKKICYAVKSMQKSNIFADESQYVHFFCTNDRNTASMFYRALQSWRSWYLKYQKGEGLKKKTPAQRNVSGNAEAAQSSSHTRGESVGSHYQLGAFSSLLDMDSFNKKLDEIEVHRPGEFPDDKPLSKLDSRAMPARMKSLKVKQPSPGGLVKNAVNKPSASQPTTRQASARRSLDVKDEEAAFTTGGLLGRGYAERQAAAQAREQQSGPFTEGPSLLSNMGRLGQATPADSSNNMKRSASTRSSHHRRASSDLQRSASKRVPGMPEPLIDLTPQYRPPPQHLNKGKGFNPGAGSGPLVESATSIEEAIKVPSSTDWRAGRPGTSRAHGTYGAGGHERTRSLKGRGEPLAAYTHNVHNAAPEDASKAFTGGGLVSQAGYSQGREVIGRGVMDGSKAKGPMVNLSLNSEFAQGSLLGALPVAPPIIDRSGK